MLESASAGRAYAALLNSKIGNMALVPNNSRSFADRSAKWGGNRHICSFTKYWIAVIGLIAFPLKRLLHNARKRQRAKKWTER
jgi:hypothetical protein